MCIIYRVKKEINPQSLTSCQPPDVPWCFHLFLGTSLYQVPKETKASSLVLPLPQVHIPMHFRPSVTVCFLFQWSICVQALKVVWGNSTMELRSVMAHGSMTSPQTLSLLTRWRLLQAAFMWTMVANTWPARSMTSCFGMRLWALMTYWDSTTPTPSRRGQQYSILLSQLTAKNVDSFTQTFCTLCRILFDIYACQCVHICDYVGTHPMQPHNRPSSTCSVLHFASTQFA